MASVYNFEVLKHPEELKAILKFRIAENSAVKLRIYHKDTEVRLLLNEMLTPGNYQVAFEFGRLLPGEYIAKLFIDSSKVLDIESHSITIK